MHPVQGGPLQLHQSAGHGLVGEEHELLDQVVGLVALDQVDAGDPAAFIESDLRLREVELQGAGLEPALANLLRQAPGVLQHPVELVLGRAAQDLQGLLVAVAALRVDHRGVAARALHAPVGCDQELDALGEPLDLGLQGAELVAERLGQHRNDPVDQVGRVPALAGLVIERRARLHVVGDVGDVHAQPPALLVQGLQREGVVEVLRVGRVDGDHRCLATVLPAPDVARRDIGAEAPHLLQDLARELQRQVVLTQHAEHVHAFGGRRTEHLRDPSLGAGVRGLPLAELDHDLVAVARRPAHIARGRHEDVVHHARVVGDHPQEVATAFQGPDHLRAPAFQHAHDHPGVQRVLLRTLP